MAGPTHFPSGLSTTPDGGSLYLMPFLDPAKYHLWFSDFDEYTAADWVETSSTTSATRAPVTGDGGLVTFSTGSAVDDYITAAQWDGNSGAAVIENFTWESTKHLFLKARLKVSDADNSDFNIGLLVTDTTPLDAADGISFLLADGDATVSAKIVNSGASSSTQELGDLADDTFATMTIAYIPGTGFQCYWNEALVGTITSTANAPTTELAISLNIGNGTTAASTLTIDYLMIAKERTSPAA